MKISNFAELDLIEPLQRALVATGYQTPTPIQAAALPPLLAGRDVLGSAQTGTGKTAAFALPLLNRLGAENRKAAPRAPRALVLAPTRELALQIADSFATYGKFLHLRHTTVMGGVGQQPQVRALLRGVHVLIATPGRLLDLMGQGHVRLDSLEAFVLDEADRMLDMGFLPDLKRIIAQLPQQRQSLFFSATMPPKIVELADQLLRDPVEIRVDEPTSTVESIDQRVIFAQSSNKMTLLAKILDGPGVGRALVFTRTKHGADRVAKGLCRQQIKAAAIHGDKSQGARQRVLKEFRAEKVHVLVATDVASRGIDVVGLTHVVNYEIPEEAESYIHRIGRTGRAGAAGVAVSLCAADERPDLHAIEKLTGQRLRVDEELSETLPPSSGSSKSRGAARWNRNRRQDPAPTTERTARPTKARRSRAGGGRQLEGRPGKAAVVPKPRSARVAKKASRPIVANVSATVLIPDKLALGKLAAGNLVTGNLVTGNLVTGNLALDGSTAPPATSIARKSRRPGRRERAAARAQAAATA